MLRTPCIPCRHGNHEACQGRMQAPPKGGFGGADCSCACRSASAPKPAPVFVLDPETLTPEAMIQPCPARADGPFIGSDATYLNCAEVDGHDGPHYFHVEWEAAS